MADSRYGLALDSGSPGRRIFPALPSRHRLHARCAKDSRTWPALRVWKCGSGIRRSSRLRLEALDRLVGGATQQLGPQTADRPRGLLLRGRAQRPAAGVTERGVELGDLGPQCRVGDQDCRAALADPEAAEPLGFVRTRAGFDGGDAFGVRLAQGPSRAIPKWLQLRSPSAS